MEKNIDHKEILTAFANYGLRKTSMEDLAKCAGVSRQTLYKWFKSKKAVLDWAVTGFVDGRYARARACLSIPEQSAFDGLLEFYAIWMGELTPLLHNTQHGSEVMDMSVETLENSGVQTHSDYAGMLTNFLLQRGLCTDQSRADEVYFLLTMAAKGLLYRGKTEEDFRTGMTRIIRTMFQPDG